MAKSVVSGHINCCWQGITAYGICIRPLLLVLQHAPCVAAVEHHDLDLHEISSEFALFGNLWVLCSMMHMMNANAAAALQRDAA
jgi:hypothetical protein